MENLPNEVLSDIFIRLLAKQLAQMRCVCKSWNILLSETSFVKSHLHRSIHNNEKILLFFYQQFSIDRSPFTSRPSHSLNLELTNFIKLPVDLQCKDGYGSVIGSVNGLICFYYKSDNHDHVVYIWNPSLSVVLTLPPCSLPYNDMMEKHFRFGYDPQTDDYKVVKLTRFFRPTNILPEVEVYSMRKGSWELISQSFPSNITWIINQHEVCVDRHDGHLHWLCYINGEWKTQMIVAYDLGAETFREIPLPDSVIRHHENCLNVFGVSARKLCLMSAIYDDKCEMWVMDDNGVAESWVRYHAFPQFSGDIHPFGFTSHNEFLFQADMYDDQFSLYDPVAAKTKTFKIKGVFGLNKIVEYLDSLVWVAPAKCERVCSISQFHCRRGIGGTVDAQKGFGYKYFA